MRVRVLGPLVVTDARDQPLPLGPPKQRTLLAFLLAWAGRAVSANALLTELWDHDPPNSGMPNLRMYAANLRRVLSPVPGAPVLQRSGSGYVITVPHGEYDLPRWRELTQAGRTALDEGDQETAVARLQAALGLWRGQALADVQLGPALTSWRHVLDEQRMTATEDLIEALLRLGKLDAAVEQAGDLLAWAPTRERAAGLLMRARYQSGDVAGALAVYQAARRALAESLGIQPGAELRQLQTQVLRRDPELAPAVRHTAAVPAQPAVPRQLPADVPGFAGRAGYLERLDELLARALQSNKDCPATVVISAIAGTAGVGKTALAVHWAHRVADRFPDGQVYLNLRGYAPGGAAMGASEALRTLLEAFEVRPQRIPASLDAQVGMYRSLLGNRRVLIVLDNARDADQVRPLLPATPGCLAVLTSRSQLSSLVAVDGAHLLTVDMLTVAEARDMLARRLGGDRVAAEPAAVEEIITSCARLPMALAIVAARAIAHPDFTLADLAAQLRTVGGRLDGLDNGDRTSMRTVFSWSYHALTPAAAQLFRVLGLLPSLDVTAPAAASLAGRPEREVRPLLAELAHDHLLTEHLPGRYTFHDLLRAYATELAYTVDSDAERDAATRRALDHYLHTAYAADRLLRPHRETIVLGPPPPGVMPEPLDDHRIALSWFAAEHPVLLSAIQHSVNVGLDTHAWQLAWAMENYLDWRGRYRELATAMRIALQATQRLGDPLGQAHTLRGMARAKTQVGDHDEAVALLEEALGLFAQLGDHSGEAATHRNLGTVLMRKGRHREALRHEQQALDLHRAAGQLTGQAMTLNNMGYQHALLGEHETALGYCRQALAMHREIGDLYEEARTWDSLGFIHSHLGNHTESIACYQRAITLCQDLGDRNSEAETLTRLGDAHDAAGDNATAHSVWRQALDILDELGHPDAPHVRARIYGSG
jgi:DNA-binding SARP family transcriptional activator/Tfp pilus assembly protein PilF